MINGPRIILWDLETLPNLLEALKVWPGLSAYPGLTLKANITSIICAGWKVYGEDPIHCINAWDTERWHNNINDDYDVVKSISSVLETADCVVTHNGKRFDWKFLQTRLLAHKLPVLPKILHVDLCQVSKSNLLLFNNRLNTVSEFLSDDKKMDHEGWPLWVRTWHKDPEAMVIMEEYCKRDVFLLENNFKRLLPFIKDIPNYNLFRDKSDEACPKCESKQFTKNGLRYNRNNVMQRFICSKCFSPFQCKIEGPRVTAGFKPD